MLNISWIFPSVVISNIQVLALSECWLCKFSAKWHQPLIIINDILSQENERVNFKLKFEFSSQLNLIINLLGTPSLDDLCRAGASEGATKYILQKGHRAVSEKEAHLVYTLWNLRHLSGVLFLKTFDSNVHLQHMVLSSYQERNDNESNLLHWPFKIVLK